MATYRNIQLSFWTDAKVADDFTPEDKYFYLYLLTNPHTNTSGCYELSIRQMATETGYSQETVERLIERFALVHDIIRYSKENKEILVINWHKYNWTKSEKLRTSIINNIKNIKTQTYKDYLLKYFDNYGNDDADTTEISPDESDAEEELVQESITPTPKSKKRAPKAKEPKHIYGEYRHVRLTDTEYNRLVRDYGEEATLKGIKKVDEYCQEHGRTYVDYNLTLRKWGIGTPKTTEQQPSDTGQVRRNLQ